MNEKASFAARSSAPSARSTLPSDSTVRARDRRASAPARQQGAEWDRYPRQGGREQDVDALRLHEGGDPASRALEISGTPPHTRPLGGMSSPGSRGARSWPRSPCGEPVGRPCVPPPGSRPTSRPSPSSERPSRTPAHREQASSRRPRGRAAARAPAASATRGPTFGLRPHAPASRASALKAMRRSRRVPRDLVEERRRCGGPIRDRPGRVRPWRPAGRRCGARSGSRRGPPAERPGLAQRRPHRNYAGSASGRRPQRRGD